MMYFRPDPELLDPRFLLLNIYGPLTKTHIELATNGSTVGHLRLGQVFSLPILWCPVEEQHAIVQYVEEETAPLEHTCTIARRKIDLIREYRARLIADVVTGKLDVRGVEPGDEAGEAAGLDEALEDELAEGDGEQDGGEGAADGDE